MTAKPGINLLAAITILTAFVAPSNESARGDGGDRPPVKMEHSAISGTEVWITFEHGKPTSTLHLKLEENAESGRVTIPRLCGRLASCNAGPSDGIGAVTIHPEPGHWIINWKGFETTPSGIFLSFDQPPVLLSELEPASASGDGSFMLHAWQATTTGHKLRFEPQTHKNTVGYWVVAKDSATWTLNVETPGDFNVGILQGCGVGQGGSTVSITMLRNDTDISKFDFEVKETGHFQNFQWRNVGTLSVTEPGVYDLRVMPKQIKNKAVMDVRAINLVRLPAAK